MAVRESPPEGVPPEPRRPGYARFISGLLWVFAAGFLIAAVQVGRALLSHRVWMDYKGEAVSQATMNRELIFFIVASVVCVLLGWQWRRVWLRDR
jgi:hypothetical protein